MIKSSKLKSFGFQGPKFCFLKTTIFLQKTDQTKTTIKSPFLIPDTRIYLCDKKQQAGKVIIPLLKEEIVWFSLSSMIILHLCNVLLQVCPEKF